MPATATAPAVMRAWVPAWRASKVDDGQEVHLVADELMSRHPAQAIRQELEAKLDDADQDRLGQAVYDLWRAAYDIGLAVPGIVADLGQPGPESGYETYLHELAKRADVPYVAGRVEADGLFHMDEEAAS